MVLAALTVAAVLAVLTVMAVQDIINSFEAFELNTSEATLRTFLKVFKHHQQSIQSVCDRLSKRLVSHSMRKALEDLRRSYQVKKCSPPVRPLSLKGRFIIVMTVIVINNKSR